MVLSESGWPVSPFANVLESATLHESRRMELLTELD